MHNFSREIQTINSLILNQQSSSSSPHPMMPFGTTSSSSHDDFFEQMLSSVNNNPSSSSSWPNLSNPNPNSALGTAVEGDDEVVENGVRRRYPFDDGEEEQSSAFFDPAAVTAAAKSFMLHQHLMLSRGLAANGVNLSNGNVPLDQHNLLPMPLSVGNDDQNGVVDGPSFKSGNPANDSSIQALFNGFSEPLGQLVNPSQHFHHPEDGAMQAHNFGAGPAAAAVVNQTVPASCTTETGTAAKPRQQRVRARRGQATDPHSIAERLRRERIAERMKGLQELVPNANKTDKASMLDEIIDYVKFLQLQVKVLSMSRLGGAAAVAPLVAEMSSDANGDGGRTNGTRATSPSNNDSITVTEHQVAKLMEEDMGSAMQYLQGKGLCLMPISLATAISTATSHSRNAMNLNSIANNPVLGSSGKNDAGVPTSPGLSVDGC